MKTGILFASAIFMLLAGAVSAQPWRGGDAIPMRDGSTIITMGGNCLVQYGRRNERINNAQRCSENDLREADRRMAGGGGRPGFDGRPGDGRPGDGRPGYGGGAGLPYGSWSQSCRGGSMRGELFQAECQNSNGRWNTTVLDMRNCPSGNAENRNGSLVCR